MTQAKNTPALEYHRGEDYAVLMRPEDTTDNACITLRFDTDEECDKWGCLIAAAPELLEACLEARKLCALHADELTIHELNVRDALDFAIAKAKGE